MDHTAEYLFEYLRNLIYAPSKAKLSISELPEGFRDFGEGLLFVGKCVDEIRDFTKALAAGDLDAVTPPSSNEIASPLKMLHATLRHLTWQTQQIAKGDYSQKVEYLGEFAEAFNAMTRQLYERREALLKEVEVSRQKTLALKQSNDLFETVTKVNSQWLVVVQRGTGEWLFYNYPVGTLLRDMSQLPKLKEWLTQRISSTPPHGVIRKEELELPSPQGAQFFSAVIQGVIWHDRPAVVFMLTDESKKHEEMLALETAANYDMLTKRYSREYGMNLLKKWVEAKKTFILCFVDIDNLKYVNDKYGHLEGDAYITAVSGHLGLFSPGAYVSRLGGDEFMLLDLGWTEQSANKRLEHMRGMLIKKGSPEHPYFHSMSYGTVGVGPQNAMDAGELLAIADKRMYEYKHSHKMGR